MTLVIKRDRPADEIEVTPEMVNAGVIAYLDYNLDYCEIEDRIEAIFLAMTRAKTDRCLSENPSQSPLGVVLAGSVALYDAAPIRAVGTRAITNRKDRRHK